jgi:hypothetical protein
VANSRIVGSSCETLSAEKATVAQFATVFQGTEVDE